MALRHCQDCKGTVSSRAKTCPHCGNQFATFGTGLFLVDTACVVFLLFAGLSLVGMAMALLGLLSGPLPQ